MIDIHLIVLLNILQMIQRNINNLVLKIFFIYVFFFKS